MASKYKAYTSDQLEEHFSNYLVDSWSYSSVSSFAQNEKAFEMQYVYQERDRRSVTSIVGNAYHAGLMYYFAALEAGKTAPSLVDVSNAAYEYLDGVAANEWRLGKTTPTVDTAIQQATERVTKLINAFYGELSVYTENLKRVISAEARLEEWVTVSGVDIPLPLHAVIDLVIETNDGDIVIIDHKSKSTQYTDEEEVTLTYGMQAIAYVLAWEEAHPGQKVAEVWFIENKESKNRDGAPQLRKHVFAMDAEQRPFYELQLYSPLRRMLQAVSDPDYDYVINPADNLNSKAVLQDFWARTRIAEVDEFIYVPEDKKELIAKRQKKIKDSSLACIDPHVITEYRKNAAAFITLDYSLTNMEKNEIIEHALRTFGIRVQVPEENIIRGFSCDTYLCDVAAGTELFKIFRLKMDLANALDVPRIRIQGEPLVMWNGKSYLGIEVNKKREEDLPWDTKYLEGHKLPIGVDNFRNTIYWDLDNNATPHALVCGSTGSGKSVCLISTLHYALAAGIEDIIILDPKMEFIELDDIPGWVRIYNDIEDIERAVAGMVAEMERRIRARERHLTLVIFDEFADANDQSRKGKQLADGEKSLQENFKMLLQKGRSSGYRVMAATQRASTDVINGTTKVNLPVQICFRVPKGRDSQVVLDSEGAEALAGNGDGLIHSPEYIDGLIRFQGFYYK